jgi:hypothetical protein
MNRPPLEQKGWLANDSLAESLLAVLRIMAEGVPQLLAAVRAIDAWADANPGAAPPRAIGAFDSSFRGAKLTAMCRPYTLWMVQRPLDAYAALSAGDRARVDRALAGTGWESLLACAPRHRMGKRENQLVLVN